MARQEQPSVVIPESQNDSTTTLLEFPLNLGAHSVVLVFKKYRFNPPGSPELGLISQFGGTGRSGISTTPLAPSGIGYDVIRLPLPSNIQDIYSLRVQGAELNFGGAEVARGVSGLANDEAISVGNLLGSLAKAIPEVNLKSYINPNMSEASRNIAFLGRRTLDSLFSGAGRAIDVGLGNTVNPKAALFFDGVNLKQFDFRWTLAPTERAESDRLKDVIKMIKKNSLPTYGSAIGFNKVLLNYPSVVDIYFQGVDQEHFLFFKSCMVQQFETNFTPNGLAFVAGGKPAMVSMGMTLMEMDIHTSEDYGGTSTIFKGVNVSPGDPTQRGGAQ